eukprot:210537-Pleurochrysis_carterae.AAC.1
MEGLAFTSSLQSRRAIPTQPSEARALRARATLQRAPLRLGRRFMTQSTCSAHRALSLRPSPSPFLSLPHPLPHPLSLCPSPSLHGFPRHRCARPPALALAAATAVAPAPARTLIPILT